MTSAPPTFQYLGLPWNLIFGAGTLARLPTELDRMGLARALVLSTPEQADDARGVANLIGERAAGVFAGAAMHVPLDTVAAAERTASDLRADCSVAFGGGSTTGLGKALALRLGLPNIAIPTTYAGSEMTNIWGTTEGNCKTTGRDNRVVPDLTIYDPDLTVSLPVSLSVTSGLNAMAQAAVNVLDEDVAPIVALMAEEAVRVLASALPKIVTNPTDPVVRAEMLYGACLAGAALGTGATSLHHRLCHVLGGLGAPHAETHTVLLPHTTAYNSNATPYRAARLARALGGDDAALALAELARSIGAPVALAEIGIAENQLGLVVTTALASPLRNAEAVTVDRLNRLLDNAFHGRAPERI